MDIEECFAKIMNQDLRTNYEKLLCKEGISKIRKYKNLINKVSTYLEAKKQLSKDEEITLNYNNECEILLSSLINPIYDYFFKELSKISDPKTVKRIIAKNALYSINLFDNFHELFDFDGQEVRMKAIDAQYQRYHEFLKIPAIKEALDQIGNNSKCIENSSIFSKEEKDTNFIFSTMMKCFKTDDVVIKTPKERIKSIQRDTDSIINLSNQNFSLYFQERVFEIIKQQKST